MTPAFDDELRELLLEHYRRPHHRGHLEQPTHTARCYNQYCGEALSVELDVEGDVVRDVGFIGDVCSVSQTAASLMADHIIGASVQDVGATAARFRRMMREGEPDPALGDMSTLAKVSAFPGRVDCALLCWRAVLEALS